MNDANTTCRTAKIALADVLNGGACVSLLLFRPGRSFAAPGTAARHSVNQHNISETRATRTNATRQHLDVLFLSFYFKQ